MWHWLWLGPGNELLGGVLGLVGHGGLPHVSHAPGGGDGVQLVLFLPFGQEAFWWWASLSFSVLRAVSTDHLARRLTVRVCS